MGLELGTDLWVAAWRDAINDSAAFRTTGQHWHWPVGIAFEAEGDRPTRYVHLECDNGSCDDARVVDQPTFETDPFGLSASYSRWFELLRGELDPIRALVFHRIQLRGDLPTIIRHIGCAKAVLEAARQVDTDVPAAAV